MILNVALALSLVVGPSPHWEKTPADSLAFLTRDHRIDGDLAVAFAWEKRHVWQMLRWSGRRWRATATPAAFARAKTVDISRSWAFAGTGGTGGTIHAWRVSGKTWTDHPIRAAGRLTDGVVAAEDEVWVAGTGKRAWRWDGATWHRQDTPRPVSRLLAAGDTDVWALSADRRTPMRWDGGHWVETPLPSGPLPPTPKGGVSGACGTKWTEPAVEITDWAADATGRVWASAEIRSHLAKCVGQAIGTLKTLALHWDGTQWQRLDLPVKPDRLEHVVTDASGAVWFGSNDRPVLVYRAGAWQRVKAPRGFELLDAMGPTADGRGIWVWAGAIHRLS